MNITPNAVQPDYQADPQQIDRMRLDILLEQVPIVLRTNLIISFVVVVALHSTVSVLFISTWAGMTLLVTLLRMYLFRHIRQKLSEKPSHRSILLYENIFAVGIMLSGTIWGSLGLAYFDDLATKQQLFIPIVAAGMSSGAVFSYWSSVKSFSAFTIPALLPLVICLSLVGLYTEATVILVYLLAVLILVKKFTLRLISSLNLRFENMSLVGYLTDVNKSQAKLLLELQAKETFLYHTFEQAGIPMMLMDKRLRIIDVNKAAKQLFGYSKQEFLQLNSLDLLHPGPDQQASPQFDQLIAGDIDQYTVTRRCINKQGNSLWLLTKLSAVRNHESEIEYVVVQAQDVTEQYQLNENLQYLMAHDELTGLPNRIVLENRLQSLLSMDEVGEHVFCYIDLDQFNLINDTYGHQAGDRLLKDVADLLRQTIDDTDLLARFSSDEFAVLMVNCQLNNTKEIIYNLLNCIRSFDFDVDGSTHKITASIGVVPVNAQSSLADLLKHADCACHVAKEMGRDRLHIFHETDVTVAQRSGEMRWVARIQQALNENLLELYSQPIVTLHADADTKPHCELLIRMRDVNGTIILPGDFLPAAERYNLAAAIDLWTVIHVLERLEKARQQGSDIAGVYGVNLSGQSLGDARFYDRIIELIQQYDLQFYGATLCFEITETAAISNMRSALHFMNELRQIGCLFALDDFGSGLSSFAYLKQLPVDFLKIDGMFVRDCVSNSVNLEIVNSMNGIAQVLGLKTIAEFVEDETTLISMKHLGIDMVQGYELGEPRLWQI